MPWGQMGRLVQQWTSRTSPMAPAQIHSQMRRAPSPAWPLVAHLSDDLGLLGGPGQRAGLMTVMVWSAVSGHRRVCRALIAAMAMTA